MMSNDSDQMHPFTHDFQPGGRGERTPQQKKSRDWLHIGVTLGIVSTVVLCLGAAYAFKLLFNAPQTLEADANTLYLAHWSRNLDHWSGGEQWQWEQPGIINNGSTASTSLLLSPYHPGNADIEVDTRIKAGGFNEVETFGIIIGVDNQDNGYFCGEDLDTYKFIERLESGSKLNTLPENTTWGSSVESSDDYATYTVKIQKNVMTLFVDGWQKAQATLPAYHPEGSIGLYASGDGPVVVQGFRIEKLP